MLLRKHQEEAPSSRGTRAESEVSEILSEAIARSTPRHAPGAGSPLDEALEVARHLDIPEDQVRAAAEAVHQRRRALRRESALRRSRREATLKALALIGWLSLYPLAGVFRDFYAVQWSLVALFYLTPVFLAARWVFYNPPKDDP